MERCLKMAEKFVMKPQREGGGNMQKFYFFSSYKTKDKKRARFPSFNFISTLTFCPKCPRVQL